MRFYILDRGKMKEYNLIDTKIAEKNNESKGALERFKAIDLFTGIGGIRLGFEQAFNNKIETVYSSEWDEHAAKTYAETSVRFQMVT